MRPQRPGPMPSGTSSVITLVFIFGAPVVAALVRVQPVQPRADQLATPSDVHADHYAEPNYHYKYAVASRKTGDVKGAWEKRAGEDVWGAYFLRDPDGHWRTVHYEADRSGFHAVVQRRPLYRRGGSKGKQLGKHGLSQDHQLELEQTDPAWEEVLAAAKDSAREENHPLVKPSAPIITPALQMEEAASAPYSSTVTWRPPGPLRQPLRQSLREPQRAPPRYHDQYTYAKPSDSEDYHRGPPLAPESELVEGHATSPRYQAAADGKRYHHHHHDEERESPTDSGHQQDGGEGDKNEGHQDHEGDGRDPEEAEEDEADEADEGENTASEHNPDDDHELVPREQVLLGSQVVGSPVLGSQVVGSPVQGSQVVGSPVLGRPVQGSPVHHSHEVLQVHPPPQRYTSHVQQPIAPYVHSHIQYVPQVHEHTIPGAGRGPQLMDTLLGPAWAEVETHSALFEGEWPEPGGNSNNLHGEEVPQDTKDVPTWVKKARAVKERANKDSKAHVASASEHGVGRGPGRQVSGDFRGSTRQYTPPGTPLGAPSQRGPPHHSSERSRYPTESKQAAWTTPSKQVQQHLPQKSTSDEDPWDFGSKVRGKDETAEQVGRGASPNNQKRGPVLFVHPHLDGPQGDLQATTPAGDSRPPPKGYAPPTPHRAPLGPGEGKTAWPHAKGPRQPKSSFPAPSLSFSGWVPLSLAAQQHESSSSPASNHSKLYGDKKPSLLSDFPGSGRPRDRAVSFQRVKGREGLLGGSPVGSRAAESRPLRATLTVGAPEESSRASVFWKQSWS